MREKEMYKKQREREKRYIRGPKKSEVKTHRYYSESEIDCEAEAYYKCGYDESDEKPLPSKKKIKRNRCNLSEDLSYDETEEEEEEDKSESVNGNRKIKNRRKRINHLRIKKNKKSKNKKWIIDYINK